MPTASLSELSGAIPSQYLASKCRRTVLRKPVAMLVLYAISPSLRNCRSAHVNWYGHPARASLRMPLPLIVDLRPVASRRRGYDPRQIAPSLSLSTQPSRSLAKTRGRDYVLLVALDKCSPKDYTWTMFGQRTGHVETSCASSALSIPERSFVRK